mmetsp:Transcript_34534/g.58488  ORF Transcript_34534/g.58488 Transcript_34534/m.58488 type:complete len:308 (+) Transcript_34534:34-957(+)
MVRLAMHPCSTSIMALVGVSLMYFNGLAVDATEFIDPVIKVDKSPGAWSVKEVGEWLDTLELPQFKEVFQEQGIDGKTLISLSEAELKSELGVDKLGHRRRIYSVIQQLNKEFPYDDGARTFTLSNDYASSSASSSHMYTPGEKGARGFNEKIQWVNSIAEGERIARQEKKPILLLIHNTACHQCTKLKSAFTTSKYADEIEQYSSKFVMINLQNEEEPSDLKYQPDGEYIPRMLFMDSEGQVQTKVNNTQGSRGFAFFYYRGQDVLREMKRAASVLSLGTTNTEQAAPIIASAMKTGTSSHLKQEL